MNIDLWQLMGALAASAFTIGFVDQLRVTIKSHNIDGLSLLQWAIFTAASAIFTAYYVHLEQWIMVPVSIFGTACCLMQSAMILRHRRMADLAGDER